MIYIALLLALVATAIHLGLLTSSLLRESRSVRRRNASPLRRTMAPPSSEHIRSVEESNYKIFTGEYSYP